MYLFSKEYQDHVRKMREKFFQRGSAEGITDVRPEILASWEAAYRIGVRPDNVKKHIASPAEFAAALENSADLLAVAEPYMQLLHSFLEPDSFWIGLMDRNGVIVRLIGSPLMLKVAKSTELMEGSYRGDTSYPGLYSTCWKMDRPFRVVSGEHPSSIDDGLAGAAAPIHDRQTGASLGVIGISGYFEKSHLHTLGLTIMAAEAISQQLELRKQNAEIQATNQMLNAALLPFKDVDGNPERAMRDTLSKQGEELLALLRQCRGNVSEVARILGVSRPTVYRKMKKYGIDLTEKWLFF